MRRASGESMTAAAIDHCLTQSGRNPILLIAAISAIAFVWLNGCDRSNRERSSVEESAAANIVSVRKTAASDRALRRAYDGAPPVIPHEPLGANCINCHSRTGIQFGEMGFAPPMPHAAEPGELGPFSRCEQCHVFKQTEEIFADSTFQGLKQDLRHGSKQHEFAPPVIPHSTFMRENCLACHSGPAAREEIRCQHPERQRCTQCHITVVEPSQFARLDHTVESINEKVKE